MKPRWVLWMYPPRWRARYRAELEALIEDSGSSGGDGLDVLKEAIKMRVLETWSFAQLAVVLGIAGLLAAAVVSVMTRTDWISQTELRMSSPVASADELSARFIQMENDTLSRTSLFQIIRDPRLNLYPEEQKSQPLEDVIERMRRKDIRIQMIRLPESGIGVKISFLYPDKYKAQQTVHALISHLEDSHSSGSAVMPMNLEVMDPPSLPAVPAKPNRYLMLSTGLGMGVLLAAVAKLAMRARPASAA